MSASMSVAERNSVVVCRIPEEVFSQGRLDVADEVIAEDYVEHALFGSSTIPGLSPGREGFKQLVAMLRAAVPDLRYTVEDLITEGDKVVCRVRVRGTHLGGLMGIPPTGRQVEVTGIHICRVVDGKLIEHWANQDDLGLLQQIGAIPVAGPAQTGTDG